MIERKRGGRPRLVLIALALASAMLGALSVEIATRIWITHIANDEQFQTYASLAQLHARVGNGGQAFSRYQAHRLVGYVPTPGFRSGNDEHNSQGFRGAEWPREKAPEEFRIVCIGGSTTYTSFVDDDALSYPAQLERFLHDAGRTNVRVINAGAAGYSSFESLANLQFRVLDLDPDLVIIYHGINDVIHRLVWPHSAYRGDDSGFLTRPREAGEARPLWLRSSLLRLLAIRFDLAKSELSLTRAFGTVPASALWWAFERQVAAGTYPSGTFQAVSATAILRANPPIYFERNLEAMVELARINGVKPVLATFASREHAADDALSAKPIREGLEEHNRIIEVIGSANDVPVFDFAGAIPEDPRLWVGAVHMGPMGAALKGRLFAEFLLQEQLIPPP